MSNDSTRLKIQLKDGKILDTEILNSHINGYLHDPLNGKGAFIATIDYYIRPEDVYFIKVL